MDKFAKKVLQKLDANGFKAYLVGGYVRDLILKRPVYDIDICTSAKPSDIKRLFGEYCIYDIGEKFGTIGLKKQNSLIEITSFRAEKGYSDGRRPDELVFGTDLYEDLKRRDFTINAIAMDVYGNIEDPFGGVKDISLKLIRSVGDPYKRMSEDYLRMLRAIRLAVKLDFKIDDKLKDAIKTLGHNLNSLSRERICSELNKIMTYDNPSKGIRLLKELDLLKYLFPELLPTVDYDQHSPYHHKNLFEHIMDVLDNVPNDLALRYAALYHDVGKPTTMTYNEDEGKAHFYGHEIIGADLAEMRLKSLKQSNALISRTSRFILNHMRADENMGKKGIRRILSKMGRDDAKLLFDFFKADRLATSPNRDNSALFELYDTAIEELDNINVDLIKLKINGYNLMEMGFKGKDIGRIKKYLEEFILDYPELNDRESLENIVREREDIN